MSQTSSTESSTSTGPSTEYVMNKKLGAIAMLLSATGMGLVGTFSRGTTAGLADADKSVIGSFLAFGRMTVGLLGFILILLLTKKIGLFRRTRLSTTVILGGVSIGLSLGCYISSTLMTSLSNAVFLIYTGPLFCTLLACIFRKEKIGLLSGIFLSLVFVGMLLTIGIVSFEKGSITFGLNLSASSTSRTEVSLSGWICRRRLPSFRRRAWGTFLVCCRESSTVWRCSSMAIARTLTRLCAAFGTFSGRRPLHLRCQSSCVRGTAFLPSLPPTGCGQ